MKAKNVVLLAFVLRVSSTVIAVEAKELYGTWQLESSRQTIVATGEVRFPQGHAPRGFLIYGEDGRMSVIILHTSRPKPDLAKLTDMERAAL